MIFGRVLGICFGGAVGGVLGAIIGYFLGARFDHGLIDNLKAYQYDKQKVQGIFFDITFTAMGHIAKADGHVNEREIHIARAIMSELKLSDAQRLKAMRAFNQGKAHDYDVAAAIKHFRAACHDTWPLKQLFLEFQIKAAYADGALQPREYSALENIAVLLGFSQGKLKEFCRFYDHAHEFQYQSHQHRHQSHTHYQTEEKDSLAKAYQILGVEKSATDKEVKQAYRKKMSEHHPDKLIAKGLPPEMVKLATEKTQQIQQAFDKIQKSRQYA